MPDESMAAKQLAILLREVGNDIAAGKGEAVLRGFGGVPLVAR